MNNKIILPMLLLVYSFFFFGCTTESEEISPNFVRLIVRNSSYNSEQSTNVVSGSIISPKRIAITDCGFIFDNGSIIQTFSVGGGQKFGNVSTVIPFPNSIDTSQLTMYAVLESGETLYSKGGVSIGQTNPVTIGPMTVTIAPLKNANYSFSATINSNPLNEILEYGVEYQLDGIFSSAEINNNILAFAFPINPFVFSDFYTISAPYDGFTEGQPHKVRFYVFYIDSSTGLPTKSFGEIQTFVAYI